MTKQARIKEEQNQQRQNRDKIGQGGTNQQGQVNRDKTGTNCAGTKQG